jgi:methylmalonyl-CoA/ethylmalonyl-CoA epimerase
MGSVGKLDHIGIVVTNLEEARAFYEQALGIPCTHVEELADRGLRVAMLPVGDVRIELIAPMHSQSEVSKFLETRGSGLHHICFESPNVTDAMTSLSQRGVRFTTQDPRPGAHGAQVAFVHPKSACGVLVELSQLPKPPLS